MDLNPRDAAFLLDTMDEIATSDSVTPPARHQAKRLRDKAEETLTE